MNEAYRKIFEQRTSDPAFRKSVEMAKEVLRGFPEDEDNSFDLIDSEQVVATLGHLMDVEDEIQECKECKGNEWCWHHLESHGELNSELRSLMRRK
jgi:hypothetical protein